MYLLEPKPKPYRRPWHKQMMLILRRGHLYMGLLLFPWAILYGVTAILFNHPTLLSDQPTASFNASILEGTSLASLPSPNEQANNVVARLNEMQQPATPFELAGDAQYAGRSFAFATIKQETQTISVLLDVKNGSGTIRVAENPPIANSVEQAPFVIGPNPTAERQPRHETLAIRLESPLHERFASALPTILQRKGFAYEGAVTVTSVPNIEFPIEADGQTWNASFNSLTGAINGSSVSEPTSPKLSVRQFLLRLHLAHGYPNETNSRWFWAIIVDAMAFAMCFWGVSGLLMWWQIKATRRLGAIILTLSAIAATVLGVMMHTLLTNA